MNKGVVFTLKDQFKRFSTWFLAKPSNAIFSIIAFVLSISYCSSTLSSIGGGGNLNQTPTLDFASVQNTALAEVWASYTQTAAALPSSTSTDTPAPLPTQTLTATTFIQVVPVGQTSTFTPVQEAACSCSSDTLNCSDFSSHSKAQACYNYCFSLGVGDVHGLDKDGNGSACESLP